MLAEVMRYINNRFDTDGRGDAYGSRVGAFSIEDGALEVDGLLSGQYCWIEGSVLNDGLHLCPMTDLRDEDFEGRIVFLVVPAAVEDLAAEIAAWCEAHADAIGGPYQSESFGGYSYTLAQGGASGNQMPAAAWQSHFASRLRPWRKLSRDWV